MIRRMTIALALAILSLTAVAAQCGEQPEEDGTTAPNVITTEPAEDSADTP
jgi:hypothetical protein